MRVLAPSERHTVVRSEIHRSWLRCQRSGLSPEAELNVSRLHEVDRGSGLMAAAAPVLDALARHLEGTGFSLLLADSSGRLVDMRCGAPVVRARVERSGAVIGQLFSETATGTNAISTALELRHGLFVRAGEHFLEGLKSYSCYGQPIFHRATRRLEGVLDISCATPDDNELLRPFLARGVCDIEERLLETGRAAQKRMLDSFQDATARGRPGLVLVLGEGVRLETPAVSALLDAGDRVLIADLASGLPGTQAMRRDVVLSGGVPVSLELHRLPGTGSGVLCRIEVTGPAPSGVPCPAAPLPATLLSGLPDVTARAALRSASASPGSRAPLPGDQTGALLPDLTRLRASRTRTLAHGEPGSGRTTALMSLAGPDQVAVLCAGDAARDGTPAWLRELETLLARRGGLVVIEEIQLLSPELTHLVTEAVRASPAWVAATSTPLAELGCGTLGLVSHLPGRVAVPPLRSYREQIPQLFRAMAAESGAAPRRLSPAAQAILVCQPWPGNLRELAAVAAALHCGGGSGEIQPAQLPEGYRHPGMPRRLTRLEQAEHDAIRAALRANGGNKAKTAAYLGISRTTLYKALRTLGIWA
jgi:transcriptional regulator of acetoin/glycerol metabolism